MTFKEYLTGLGFSEEQVNSIVDGMPENKFYIANEENLDTRLAKLKEQKEQTDTELANANKLVQDLQKAVKDNEDATAKITQYQQEAAEAKAKQAEIEKTYALKDALREAGATDIEYMMFKLGDVELDENGAIKDLESKVKGLQESNPDWFKAAEAPKEGQAGYKPIDTKLEGGAAPTPEATALAAFEAAVGVQNT
ncbi:phage scaffolding protein [Vagococcus lutrae]|uniref:phage scaffolding protein n=1 Tax=Vagococcus lutrae TaxID=81947 RepID=UPI0028901A84|nr:phage scaffolding protein [Vagococcus lutrae]MDT2818669.1 phage scaffolding protein [Vagococcus lutrae]MDT2843764.1 phage scaffolding protein [Vagococcus lutrae]